MLRERLTAQHGIADTLHWSDPVPFVGIASADKLGLHRSRAI